MAGPLDLHGPCQGACLRVQNLRGKLGWKQGLQRGRVREEMGREVVMASGGYQCRML